MIEHEGKQTNPPYRWDGLVHGSPSIRKNNIKVIEREPAFLILGRSFS